jgi:hypothetical protein
MKMALTNLLRAWWWCVAGILYSLSVDLSIVAHLIKDTSLTSHVHLLREFLEAALPQQIDTAVSGVLFAAPVCLVSYGMWLIASSKDRDLLVRLGKA